MSREDGRLLMRIAADLIADLAGKRGGFVPFAVALTTEGPLRPA